MMLFRSVGWLVLATVAWGLTPLRAMASMVQLPSASFARIYQASDASTTNAAVRAMDGSAATYSLTANTPGSFWAAELPRPYALSRIEVVNRSAPNDKDLQGLQLKLLNMDDQVVFQTSLTNPGPGGVQTILLPASLTARGVWIGLSGTQTNGAGKYQVGLAEVRVFGENALPYGPEPVATVTNVLKVTQSSDYGGPYPASNALDGNVSTFTHTANQTNSYWLLDLGRVYPIDKVEVVNRVDCCDTRLAGLVLRVLDGASNSVANATLTNPGLGKTWTYNAPAGTVGRYVRIGLEDNHTNGGGNYYVTLAETRVYSGSTNLVATSGGSAPVTTNLASGKTSYMVRLTSSILPAANANDDDYATDTRTTTQSVDGYWEVDLGTTLALYGVRVIGASGIGSRLTNTMVRLFDQAHESVFVQRLTGSPDVFDSDLKGPVFARYVRIGLEDKQRTDPAGGLEWYIGMREVEVFGRPTNSIGIQSFTATPASAAAGAPVTLEWRVEDVRRVEIHPAIGSVGDRTAASGTGSLTLVPPGSTEYFLVASNAAGPFIRAASVEIDTVPLPVRINEIVADNQYSLEDGYGEAPDWIELRNPANTAVDMAGYGLSDNPAAPWKWRFPSVIIPPHGILMVFASGRKEAVDPAGGLHTNFRLRKEGGALVLTAPDGTVADSLAAYPELDTDLAYGRDLDGRWCFLEPTPRALNLAPAYEGWLRPLVFSHSRGFHQTNFTLTLSNVNAGAQVYYSTNGAAPAQAYGNGIPITGTRAVRAQVVKPGCKPSRIQNQTYIFLDDVIRVGLPQTSVAKNPSYAPRLKPGLLSLPTISLIVPGQPEFQEKEGSVEVFWPNGDPSAQANCGVTRFGGSWQEFAKKSFRIKCRARYGASKLQTPLLNGFDRGILARTAFDELEFRSGSQDMIDRGFYVAGRFVEDTMLDMGTLNPHGRYVHLYLNGAYWGQYDAREPLVEHFLADYLGGSADQYVNVRGNDNVGDNFTMGTPEPPNNQAWDRVLALAGSYQKVQAYLDIDNFIDFMLLWNYGNCESEFRSCGTVEAGTGFKFWMADADGFLRTSALGLDRTSNPGPAGIFGKLMTEANPDFKMRLADRIYSHCYNNGALTPARNDARLAARMAEIRDSLVVECSRWTYRTPANWESAAATLRSGLFPTRTTQLVTQCRNRGWFPSFLPPTFNQYGGTVAGGFIPQLTSTNGTIYYTLDGSDPRLPGGAIAPGALKWTPGSVAITNDLTVNARVRTSAGVWSALAQPRFLVGSRQAPTARDLLVTEINYHPLGTEAEEFIELWNRGTNLLDLSGVLFTNEVRFVFTNGFTLAPGAFLVVVKDRAAFAQRYQDPASPWHWPGLLVAGEYLGSLGNQGGTLSVVASNGLPLVSVSYQPGGIWPLWADGRGGSLELRPPPPGVDTDTQVQAYAADGLNWLASAVFHGSPGRLEWGEKNVVISEIMAQADIDADWVELWNRGSQPASLADCSLTGTLDEPLRYSFPAGTVLEPGKFLVLNRTQLGFGLDAHGGQLALLQRSGTNVIRFVDTLDFPALTRNESFGLATLADGTLEATELAAPTPGNTNRPARVGPVVISEIHYAPAAGRSQFIELANISANPVALFDPAHPERVWQVEGVGNFSLPAGIILAPNSACLLCATNPAGFRQQYNLDSSVPVFGPWPGGLQTNGETLKLLRPGLAELDGTVPYYRVDHVTYRAGAPWPVIAGGASIDKFPVASYGNDPAHWQAGRIHGTPGLLPGNQPPVWTLQLDLSLPAGSLWEIPLYATDPNLPARSLAFQATGLPPGFRLATDPLRLAGQATTPGDYPVEVTASNDLTPPLSATLRFVLRITEPFVLAVRAEPGLVRMTFPAIPGQIYRVEYSDSLGPADWRLLDEVAGTAGAPPELVDPAPIQSAQRYYRVRWLR